MLSVRGLIFHQIFSPIPDMNSMKFEESIKEIFYQVMPRHLLRMSENAAWAFTHAVIDFNRKQIYFTKINYQNLRSRQS